MITTGENKIKCFAGTHNFGEHIFVGIVSAIFDSAFILLFKFLDEVGINIITPVEDIQNRLIFTAGTAKKQQNYDYY
jgi:hypothetical protein